MKFDLKKISFVLLACITIISGCGGKDEENKQNVAANPWSTGQAGQQVVPISCYEHTPGGPCQRCPQYYNEYNGQCILANNNNGYPNGNINCQQQNGFQFNQGLQNCVPQYVSQCPAGSVWSWEYGGCTSNYPVNGGQYFSPVANSYRLFGIYILIYTYNLQPGCHWNGFGINCGGMY